MIVVIGSINLDLTARVERLPGPGETVNGNEYVTSPGGKGANQALAARRAGAKTRMIGAVGNDTNAQVATELMRAAGVDLSKVKTVAHDIATGVALILVDDRSGENQIAVVAGANGTLVPDDLAAVEFNSDDCVVLQMEVPSAINVAAIEAAHAAGATSIFNIAPYGDDAPDLAKKADITIANETEFDALCAALDLNGADRIAQAEDFAAQTGKTIIITLGPDGALAVQGGENYRAQSPKIEAVDTVGAGDTFCGAFAVALNEGKAMENALQMACAAGALACLKRGAQPAIPTRAEIDDFLGC